MSIRLDDVESLLKSATGSRGVPADDAAEPPVVVDMGFQKIVPLKSGLMR
jgi:hypothetical protein